MCRWAGLSWLGVLTACPPGGGESSVDFSGTVKRGERFAHRCGDQFVFALEPAEFGWNLAVYGPDGKFDLATLTPPLHGPNPRFIEGGHFRNADNTGPNEGDGNWPQRERDFVFSPETVPYLEGKKPTGDLTWADIERFKATGSGRLTIDELRLTPPGRGGHTGIEEMRFHCHVRWAALPSK